MDAATAARQLIADTPGTAALSPEEREHLHQTIEGIIIRARGAQHLLPERRPWATRYQAQTGRDPRRGDSATSEGEEHAS